uniref:Uncharacterized protein n=1 Tax=Anguilla anguilla TaxID=7936 RepID=A0A0E9QFB4_ANGAN
MQLVRSMHYMCVCVHGWKCLCVGVCLCAWLDGCVCVCTLVQLKW